MLTSLEFLSQQTLVDILVQLDFSRLIVLLQAFLVVVLNQFGFQVLRPDGVEHVEEELPRWKNSFLQVVVR